MREVSEESIVCPYCNRECDYIADAAVEEIICEHCCKTFRAEAEEVIVYELFRNCGLNGGEHEWKRDERTLSATQGFYTCSKCDVYKSEET